MDTLYVWLTSNAVAALVTTGALGLVIGSFLNVVIHRLPVMLERTWLRQCQEMSGAETSAADAEETYNLITPRSRCPHCNHNITALQNIPVISFLRLKGKCVACGHPISWRYPIVELLTAILSMVVVWHFGMTFAGGAALLFTWMLIALAVIDFDHQILPDNLTLPLIWIGLLVNLYPNPAFAPLTSAVIGAVAGYLSLWSVFHIFKLITGKEGMGYGDFKLFAAFGAWLGWQNLPLMVLLASLVGAIVGGALILVLGRDRQLPIPFGPFLCAAGWIALLWGNDLTRFYLQFAGLN
ncbi:MAG: A24 family peptidase [Gammaproteobacteria bacterium]|nr:prepilin peptidase [Pseudomonadota bacterium]MCZ6733582.1 A24 family peptidase [Gammaproteobacteria bacterium]